MCSSKKIGKYVSKGRKICLHLCVLGHKYHSFELDPDSFESIDAWTHEYSELYLWYMIKEYTGWTSKKMNERIPAYNSTPFLYKKQTIPHIIISLHTSSVVDYFGFLQLVDSDVYYKLLSKYDEKTGTNLTQSFIIDIP